jgi:hypothetical protein
MAFGTVFRSLARSGTEFHMASNALLMKCIGFLGILRVLYVGGIMALQAAFGNLPLFGLGRMALAASDQGLFGFWRMVMAIEAIQGVPIGGGVGLVVEKHFAGIGVVHSADGLFRRFHREGGIAYDGNQQQLDRHGIGDHTVLLRSHLRKFLTVLGWMYTIY